MRFAPGKLFHAVVISGAALTACGGGQRPTTANIGTKAAESAQAPRPTKAEDTERCPPGSELPYPPCFLIL